MHTLIVGMTESGKSTLAKIMAKQLRSAGAKVAVLDPILDPAWEADFKTDDINRLARYLRENRQVFVIVDESGEIFSNGTDLTHAWLATRSRHYGHSVIFVAQRAMQIPKLMRDQCNRLYLFTSSVGDGKIHSEEWNKPQLENCNSLPQLQCYCADRYGHIKQYRIDNYDTVVAIGESDSPGEAKKKPRSRVKPG